MTLGQAKISQAVSMKNKGKVYLYTSEDTVQKTKMQFTNWKKMFAKLIAHKGLTSRRDKEFF